MSVAATERLRPPFAVRGGEDAFWVEDAGGRRFGYCYFQTSSQVGGRPDRLDRVTALRTARWIARQATAWAQPAG